VIISHFILIYFYLFHNVCNCKAHIENYLALQKNFIIIIIFKFKISRFVTSICLFLFLKGKPLESTWVNNMKQAFLDKEDVNVIIVGWREGASNIFYPQAVANSRLVGAQVRGFLYHHYKLFMRAFTSVTLF